ncbi:MAG: EamA family transporter [Actinobacteria bacterium]|nr:EamA family transporter [Actinomycetota bacterium]
MSNRLVLATVFLVAILIGANFTMLKFALDHTTPMLLASMRTVVGGTFLIGFALLRGERLPRRFDDLRNIFVISLSITTVSSTLLVFGVNRVPAGVASLMSSTMPLFTAVLSALLLGAAVSRVAGIGLGIGLAGTVILASPSLSGDTVAIGIISLAVSALAWAFGTVYMKWRDFGRVSPVMLVGVQLAMSAVVLVPFALIVEGTAETEWTVGLLGPVLYAAIPANAVTFALMATIVSRATPTQASATAYLIPVFGVFFGWLIRDEVLGAAEVIGGALVVTGVYVLVTSNARRVEKARPSAASVDTA